MHISETAKKTPVDIISGFLGSGKTTLLNEMLANQYKGMRIAVIENEFGKVDIDSSLLPQELEITKITGGCVCCTLKLNLIDGIRVLIERYGPDRIVIETTGIAKLSDVVLAAENEALSDIACTALRTTVINPGFHKKFSSSLGLFYSDQIKSANTVYISRAQNTDKQIIEDVISDIRRLNEKSTIVTGALDIIKPSACDTMTKNISIHKEEHHHHDGSAQVFESTYIDTEEFESENELKSFIEKTLRESYPKTVYRIKGTVSVAGRGVLVQWASGELELSHAKSPQDKLVIVTGETNIKESHVSS